MKRNWLILLGIITVAGCASEPPAPVAHPYQQSQLSPPLSNTMLRILYHQYHAWYGAPYRWGGLSKRGVDCSGFVYLTFRDRLGITLPRSTHLQSSEGRFVPRASLEPGDLVFFHTGHYRHVGIYLEQGKFLHVSTKAGVKISRMSDPYWKRNYWKAVRLEGLRKQLLAIRQ